MFNLWLTFLHRIMAAHREENRSFQKRLETDRTTFKQVKYFFVVFDNFKINLKENEKLELTIQQLQSKLDDLLQQNISLKNEVFNLKNTPNVFEIAGMYRYVHNIGQLFQHLTHDDNRFNLE